MRIFYHANKMRSKFVTLVQINIAGRIYNIKHKTDKYVAQERHTYIHNVHIHILYNHMWRNLIFQKKNIILNLQWKFIKIYEAYTKIFQYPPSKMSSSYLEAE